MPCLALDTGTGQDRTGQAEERASDDAGTGGFAPQSPAFTICQVGDEWSDPCVAKVPAQYGMAHAGQGARSQVTAERVRGSVGDQSLFRGASIGSLGATPELSVSLGR